MNPNRRLAVGGVVAVSVLALSWSLSVAQLELGQGRDGPETVESIVVSIDIAAGGAELAEPIALDLGLGFPLWLGSLGRADGETLPFGAVAHDSTVERSVAPGSRATFTFSASAEAGADVLKSTSQLLQGVRLSDIARIGFMSRGDSNWILAGYEIDINGRPFAAHAGVDASVEAVREAATFRAAELTLDIAPLDTEVSDLRALVDAGLATEEDLLRLDELTEQRAPLLAEQTRLAALRQGTYPWFEESEFASPWRSDAVIGSVRVTVDTDVHPMADTRNIVYFGMGGHKLLIGTPETPLTGEFGPQTFEWNLLSAPLGAADMRGFAVGMLGAGEIDGVVPDRWHPRRLLVEVDGSIVYDSDASEVDRRSLAAIRIVPPAHVGPDAAIVDNAVSARETYVWHAGSGAGLNLTEGGVAELPPPDDPLYPEAEGATGGPSPGMDDGLAFDDEFLFPGEYWPGGDPGWHPGWDPGWMPEPWWPGSGWSGSFWWLPGLFDELLADLLDDVLPIGEPFQITNVRITAGWREGDVCTIEWEVEGDATSIESFTVELLGVHPHDDPFLLPGALADAAGIDPADRHWHLIVPSVGDAAMFMRPLVTGISSQPLIPDDGDFGPARPLFPATSTEDMVPPLLGWSGFLDGGGVSHDWPLELDGNPAIAGRSLWSFPVDQGHTDLVLGDPRPGHNFGFRADPADRWIGVQLDGGMVTGHCRVIANAGFLGEPDPQNSANFTMYYVLTGPGFAVNGVEAPVTVTAGVPQPLPLMEIEFDTTTIAPGAFNLTLLIGAGDLTGGGDTGSDDPNHPPAMFGVRVVPVVP